MYKNDEKFKIIAQKLFSIPFLPEHGIVESFDNYQKASKITWMQTKKDKKFVTIFGIFGFSETFR